MSNGLTASSSLYYPQNNYNNFDYTPSAQLQRYESPSDISKRLPAAPCGQARENRKITHLSPKLFKVYRTVEREDGHISLTTVKVNGRYCFRIPKYIMDIADSYKCKWVSKKEDLFSAAKIKQEILEKHNIGIKESTILKILDSCDSNEASIRHEAECNMLKYRRSYLLTYCIENSYTMPCDSQKLLQHLRDIGTYIRKESQGLLSNIIQEASFIRLNSDMPALDLRDPAPEAVFSPYPWHGINQHINTPQKNKDESSSKKKHKQTEEAYRYATIRTRGSQVINKSDDSQKPSEALFPKSATPMSNGIEVDYNILSSAPSMFMTQALSPMHMQPQYVPDSKAPMPFTVMSNPYFIDNQQNIAIAFLPTPPMQAPVMNVFVSPFIADPTQSRDRLFF